MNRSAMLGMLLLLDGEKSLEPATLDNQSIEMPHHVIGEKERAELGFHHLLEGLGAGKELVAMRTLDALNAFLSQYLVQHSARPAVAVEHDDAVIACSRGADLAAHAFRDFFGTI